MIFFNTIKKNQKKSKKNIKKRLHYGSSLFLGIIVSWDLDTYLIKKGYLLKFFRAMAVPRATAFKGSSAI